VLQIKVFTTYILCVLNITTVLANKFLIYSKFVCFVILLQSEGKEKHVVSGGHGHGKVVSVYSIKNASNSLYT
jgi:hypothetical protein